MIKPIYSRFDYTKNRWEFALTPEDFEKVQQGYACGECLEDFMGEFKLVCPLCKHSTAGGDRILVDSPQWS
jgi:hypothetical protein